MKYIHINVARHKLQATSYISTESTDYYSYVHIQENPRLINDYSENQYFKFPGMPPHPQELHFTYNEHIMS